MQRSETVDVTRQWKEFNHAARYNVVEEELKRIAVKVREALLTTGLGENARDVVGKGVDGGPSYRADVVADRAAIEAIDALSLNMNILSEESPFIDRKAEQTIIIDPLDGSENMVNGIPFYAVSLAVGTKSLSGVKYGLVMNIVTGDVFYAEKGKGAFFNSKPIHVRKYDEKQSLFFIYMGANASLNSYDIARKSSRIRSLGAASLEMCYLAGGIADLFFMRCSDNNFALRIVDIAASSLILREAGGEVYDLTGNLLDMKFDIGDRKSLLAVGDKNLRRLAI